MAIYSQAAASRALEDRRALVMGADLVGVERDASVAIAGRAVSPMNQTARAIKARGASADVFEVDLCDVAQAEGFIATEAAGDDRASFYTINRIGQVSDIASAAHYLCSQSAS
jgi:hypothetical protein